MSDWLDPMQEMQNQLDRLRAERDAAYLELVKQRPAITAVFDRDVWDRAKKWDEARSHVRTPRPTLTSRMLNIVLQKPEWSARLPLDHLPEDEPESDMLLMIARAFNAGLLPAGRMGTITELFRHSKHEVLLEKHLRKIDEESLDEDTMEAVFSDALRHLQRLPRNRRVLTSWP